MKSMSELIQSVKDEKLKKVAEDLKEKLSNVGRIITEKRKKGEQVTESESVSLKKSLSGYVKKGLSATLVSAMLVSMLSGCDTLLTEVERGTGETETVVAENSGENLETGEVLFDSVYNIGSELFDESEETYNNGLGDKYGLQGIFEEINFEKLLANTNYSDYLDLMEAKLQERFENNEAFKGHAGDGYYDMAVASISQIANGEKRGVVLTSENNEWENLVLFSKQNFAIRSKNKNTGKLYLTGFVNGEFKNDLKIIDESAEMVAKSIIQDNQNYEGVIASIQKEFWGMILRDVIDPNSKAFSGDVVVAVNMSNGNFAQGVNYDATLTKLMFMQDGKFASEDAIKVETGKSGTDIQNIILEVKMQQIADNANQELN